MPDEIRLSGQTQAQFQRVQPVSPSAPPALARASTANERASPRATEPQPALLVSGDLVVEIDKDAGRFVHKVLHPSTGEVLRQYPSEDQLKFSRALAAALRERWDVKA